MGFLDKLLGRSKETAENVGESAKDFGEKAKDEASELGDKAKDTFDRDDAGSDVAGSEQRLDDVRDQTMRDEGRLP